MNKQFVCIGYLVFGAICSFSRLIDGDVAVYLEWISKPLLMPVLFLYLKDQVQDSRLLSIGLLFAWFGDLFLMVAGDAFILFLLGLLSFLVMQILYIIYYRKKRIQHLPDQSITYIFYTPVIGLGILFYVMMFPNLDAVLKIAVGVYAIALVSMNIAALSRWKKTSTTSFSLVSLGALLFMISDMMIGYNKFVSQFSNSGFWIMLTYFIGQFMIVDGLIRHKSVEQKE